MKANTIKRIFITDDDPFWTAMLTQILSELGYNDIVTFENGTDCINNLHLNPNLVFLDYQMDDVDGLKVLQSIKSYYPGISVVFCTALEDLSIALSAIDYGSFEYLLKGNASKKQVSSIIESVIAEKNSGEVSNQSSDIS